MTDRLPWSKFNWSDWENDPALALVSMGAQGLWMRLLCIAAKEGGYVLVGGQAPTAEKLAKIVRADAADVAKWLEELEAEGVFSRTGQNVIYSRRIVREMKESRRNSENGKKGGNPNLRKQTGNSEPVNPLDNPPADPPVKADKIREEKKDTVSNETGAEAPLDDLAEIRALPVAKGCWRLAVKVLVERGEKSETQARAFVGKLKHLGLSDAELWEIAEAAWTEGTLDPIPYLQRCAENAMANRGTIATPSPERQRAWMQEFIEKPNWWNAGERGPRPGHEACRISAEIQREFGIEPFAADLLTMPQRGAA